MKPYLLDNLVEQLKKAVNAKTVSSPEVVTRVVDYIEKELTAKVLHPEATWQAFKAFWPPRCVEALRTGDAVVFFGAGLSVDSGIPSWNRLLSEQFGLEKSLIEDEDLASDPLTLAELASQYLGNETLQVLLRDVMNRPTTVSVNHLLLAGLRCPTYITTNYDCLFERAWSEVMNPAADLLVVTNEADMTKDDYLKASENGSSVLFKVHGSSAPERADEHMILTRRDYRNHYRQNRGLFDAIREKLRTKHTVFLGFSHKDPEVSRLVEDAIYAFEQSQESTSRPQFYSLQFDMRAHTPEVFAARGIVALTPPAVGVAIENVKTACLAVAVTDLIAAAHYNFHSRVSIEHALTKAIQTVAEPIGRALARISSNTDKAAQLVASPTKPQGDWLQTLCADLGPLASQGVYVLDEQGVVTAFEVPRGLDKAARTSTIAFNNRPYFRQAKSFREPFVSDTAQSIYNMNATFFLCVPILRKGQMAGLLFSAAQVGQWNDPLLAAREQWEADRAFLLMDSNGVCIVPPLDEFQASARAAASESEDPNQNVGYSYSKLLSLSRRDELVRHISKSVVPVTQDDDVLTLSADFRQFTIVSEVPKTRWKIGISIPVPFR